MTEGEPAVHFNAHRKSPSYFFLQCTSPFIPSLRRILFISELISHRHCGTIKKRPLNSLVLLVLRRIIYLFLYILWSDGPSSIDTVNKRTFSALFPTLFKGSNRTGCIVS